MRKIKKIKKIKKIIIIAFILFLFLMLINFKKSYAISRVVDDGTYYIVSAIDSNYVLDIAAASREDRANVQIWQRANVSQQRFKIEYLNNGYYRITSENSGKVLDVNNGGNYDGVNVQQFSYNGTDAQLWQIKDLGNGYYSFISKCNGKYLDVLSGIAENGRNVETYSSTNTNAQKFKLEKYQNGGSNNPSGNTETPKKTIDNGTYVFKSAINNNYVLDIAAASKNDRANVQIWQNANVAKCKCITAKI